MVDELPDLGNVRRRLAAVSDDNGLSPQQRTVTALYGLVDAMLLLLPPTPVEDRHTVDDVPPWATTEADNPEWVFGTWQIAIRGDRGGLIEWRMSHPDIVWFTDPAEAEQFAAVLLSAAARARTQQESGS
jgi:hypothetical protein